MDERDASVGRAILPAATVLLLGLTAFAQQQPRTATVPTVPAAHTRSSRPAGAAPHFAAAPPRSMHAQPSAVHADALGPVSGLPQPTWELPKNVTPHWETQGAGDVQPNPVQGNPPQPAGVGYGALPYYSFVDPYAVGDASAIVNGDTAGADAIDDGSFTGDESQDPAQPQRRKRAARREYVRHGTSPATRHQAPSASRRAPYLPAQNAKAGTASPDAVQSDGLEHLEVTLVFNNGRPPKKVRSYVMTGSKILVIEHGHQSQIPLTDLDRQATVKRNRDAGVDFTLPEGSR